MNSVQANKSFNQDHAYKASFTQVVDHQAHLLIYLICFMHQEIPHKGTLIEDIKIIKAYPTSHRYGQSRDVCKNHVDVQFVKHKSLLHHSQRDPQKVMSQVSRILANGRKVHPF